MTQQNTNAQPQQEQHVIASPNPTVDDSKTPAAVAPKKVTGTKIQPANSTTTSPSKQTTKPKRKRKSRQ